RHPAARPARPPANRLPAAGGPAGARPLPGAGPRPAAAARPARARARRRGPHAGVHRGLARAARLAGPAAAHRAAHGAAGAGGRLSPLPRGRDMTWTLVRKLLRDVRVLLVLVCVLLGGYQVLWAKVTERIVGDLAPFLMTLAGMAGARPPRLGEQPLGGRA